MGYYGCDRGVGVKGVYWGAGKDFRYSGPEEV